MFPGTAPAAELELTINITRNITALQEPEPSPTNPPTNLTGQTLQ